jgi:hypothetical protein
MTAAPLRTFVLIAIAIPTLVFTLPANRAAAGTYKVYGCHIYGQPTHDMGAYGYPHYNAWDDCAAGRELNSVAEVNQTYGYQEEGGWAAYAPAGTSFKHVEVNAREQLYNGGGGSGLVSAGYVCWSRSNCSLNSGGTWLYENGTSNPMLGVGNAGNGQWGSYRNYQFDAGLGQGVDVARLGFYCGLFTAPGSPCRNGAADKHWLKLSSFTFEVNDFYAPNAPTLAGALTGGGWKRGVVNLAGTASDVGGGVSLTRFSLAGAAVTADNWHSCDRHPSGFNRLQPCPSAQGFSFDVDTTKVADGAHPLQVWTTDPSGAEGPRTSQTVYVDNTAPAAPTAVKVTGGDGWRPGRSFAVTWANPGAQYAPISSAHWQLCRAGGSCTTGSGAGTVGTSIQVPDQPGDYSLRLWLEDAAGNTNAANVSDPVHLRYDPVPPGEARAAYGNGWINAVDAGDYPLPLDLAAGAAEPISGVAGYSVTTDGSAPDATIEAPGRRPVYRIASLPEGAITIKTRAVSGAGVASVGVGQTQLKVDKSPPAVAVTGAPEASRWVRDPVSLAITASDQPQLSGMAPASANSPVETGGHLGYQLDGGALQRVRGSDATVRVEADGRHLLTYYAVDFAGNRSAERTVEFKIDKTAPETVGFEGQDPTDPLRLSVLAEDRLSGVVGGELKVRPSAGGDWVALPTTLNGNRLIARVDDALPDGTYEYIATVRDDAGNERNTDRKLDGSKMELRLPVRLQSRARIAAATTDRKRCKARRGKRCTTRPQLKAAIALKVRYRAHASVVGVVETTDARAIPNAAVEVQAANRTGGPFRTLGHTRASSTGRFTFRLPAGPSRIVRFVYEGDNLIKSSVAQARTLVPAPIRLRVSRPSVRNGESVVFGGRLVGHPIPSSGKVVFLQARVGRSWRTFANPQADRHGRFSYRYTFTATTGFRIYAIRARAARDTSYSYETGTSKPVKVRVQGR